MNLELEAYVGELTELRRLKSIIKNEILAELAEKLGEVYFIAGESGLYDKNGLPERIHVCPAYGCDWIQIYTRSDLTSGPEY